MHEQYAHLYGRQWRVLRDGFLRAHPLCRYCLDLGYVTAATVVDHIKPHRGDRALFFDQSNWQALCKQCHDSVKRVLERSGRRLGTRLDGTPVDPSHPWNRDDEQLALNAPQGDAGRRRGHRGRISEVERGTARHGANFHIHKTGNGKV